MTQGISHFKNVPESKSDNSRYLFVLASLSLLLAFPQAERIVKGMSVTSAPESVNNLYFIFKLRNYY